MKAISKDGRHLVTLDRGENIMECLTRYAGDEGLLGGVIQGIGALEKAELGYYHLARKEYARKVFSGEYELVSFNGNLSLKDEQPFVHAHVALGDEAFRLWGGHLFEAEVAVTAEISIFPLGAMPVRQFNSNIGLALIDGCPL